MADPPDTNSHVADRLLDMAAAQDSPQKRWGYKRAAAAIRNLETPLDALRDPDGSLVKIPHVGPASTRVILMKAAATPGSGGTFRTCPAAASGGRAWRDRSG